MISKKIKAIYDRIRMDKKASIIYLILHTLVILTMIRSYFSGRYESMFTCCIALVLMLIPAWVENSFHIDIPGFLQAVIYIFIFAAEILGEINDYYILIPGWDTMLHTINGFLCGAIGFSLVELLNKKTAYVDLSPFFISVAAFCFSMTVGVCWEFFECSTDIFLLKDSQKDTVIDRFYSVKLHELDRSYSGYVEDIKKTTIETEDGQVYVIDHGYIDVGIYDTMEDLWVNCIGALTFSVIGYFYLKNKPEKSILDNLLITKEEDES